MRRRAASLVALLLAVVVCTLAVTFAGSDRDALLGDVPLQQQEQFDAIVKLADEVYESSSNQAAAVTLVRAALKLCPGCPASVTGSWTNQIFYIDSFKDRQVLYKQILPELYSAMYTEVLWVGVQPYTLRYEELMAANGIALTSIEWSPDQAMYGSTHKHVTDAVQSLGKHVKDGTFDAVICNGVIGWGLDKEKDLNDALAAMHRALRPKGTLILGYNRPGHFPYWNGTLLPLFSNSTLGAVPHEVDIDLTSEGGGLGHHVYEIFEKEETDSSLKAHSSRRGGRREAHASTSKH